MFENLNRRQALQCAALTVGGSLGLSAGVAQAAGGESGGADAKRRRFTMCFSGGPVGVKGPMGEMIDLASRNGFEAVAPNAKELARMKPAERAETLDLLKTKKLVWGPSSLTVNFRSDDDAEFEGQLKELPAIAQVLKGLGADRVKSYVMPRHDTLTYLQNFKRHRDRLSRIANVLGDHGLRLALEHVGTKHLWTASRYPFVHTLAEMGELIEATGRDNVGYLVDTWHWYVTNGTVEELRALDGRKVIAADLNDAPLGIEVDDQNDGARELPMATGVIDTKGFLEALVAIGYDGPVQAEPMNKAVGQMDNETAAAATGVAMRKAFDLVDRS